MKKKVGLSMGVLLMGASALAQLFPPPPSGGQTCICVFGLCVCSNNDDGSFASIGWKTCDPGTAIGMCPK